MSREDDQPNPTRSEGPAHREESDRLLMRRIAEDETACLQVLMNRYAARLVVYASDMVAQADEAEDIVQETFVRVWRNRNTWTPSGTVSAYLYRITRNIALNALRSRRAQQKWDRLAAEALIRDAPRISAEEDLERELLREEVEGAIASLPPRRREIFVLARYHCLSHREIADALGISLQTVSNQMSSALADLRRSLSHRMQE
jgi:RNA polymerase sigma-70 factor, ECF subfamily